MDRARVTRRAFIGATSRLAAATAIPVSAHAPSPTAAPSAATEGKPGGTLTETWGEWPVSLNALRPRGGTDRRLNQLSTARLINYNTKREPIPDLAETWEGSSNGLIYTFHLTKSAKWSDGQPFTSKDVELTYTWAANEKTGTNLTDFMQSVKGAAEYGSGAASSVAGIKLLDDYTIQFELTQPDAIFLSFITGFFGPYILPHHVLKDMPPDQFDKSTFVTDPTKRVFLGPFKITAAVQDQYVELSRNDTYFKGKPYLDKYIGAIIQNEATALAALQRGEVDVANIPGKDYPLVKDNPNLNFFFGANYNCVVLMFNMSKPYLQDRRIREAVLRSIDRKTYVDKILAGLGEVWDSIIVQPDWLSPNIVHYDYDPEKAKALLKEADWDPNREVEYVTYGYPELTTVLQQSTQAIGFKIKPVSLEYAAWAPKMEAGDFDLIPVGGPSMQDDPNDLSGFLECDVWARYCNQKIQDLFAQGRTESDLAKRKQIYYQIQDIMNKELPWLVLYHPKGITGLRKRVHPAPGAFDGTGYEYLYYEKWWVE